MPSLGTSTFLGRWSGRDPVAAAAGDDIARQDTAAAGQRSLDPRSLGRADALWTLFGAVLLGAFLVYAAMTRI
jgi:hypothetical protein